MITKLFDEIKQRIIPEIYFTMDVEGDRTLMTGVPTTYFIDHPLGLPGFCFNSFGLHVHVDLNDLDSFSFQEVYEILKKRKEKLELKTGKKIKYFRPGWLIDHPKLRKAVRRLNMKTIMTNVRYYTAWLPKKKIVFIVHSYNSEFFVRFLILYLKIFHPFGKWRVFE